MDEKSIPIKADTPEEFMDKAHDAIGNGDELGETTFDLSPTKWTVQNGKVVKGELKVTVKITRATWGGATGSAAKALRDIEAWIKQHEQKHAKLATDIVAKAKQKFEKDIVGKTEADAQKLLDKIQKDIDDAYAALDAREGRLTVSKDANGAYSLTPGGA
jgi:hypothetical protein